MPKIVNLPGSNRPRRKPRPEGNSGERYLAALAAAHVEPVQPAATISDLAHLAYRPGFADQAKNLSPWALRRVRVSRTHTGFHSTT